MLWKRHLSLIVLLGLSLMVSLVDGSLEQEVDKIKDWGQRLLKAGDVRGAMKKFDAASHLDPLDSQVLRLLGRTQEDLGFLDEALASFEKVLEMELPEVDRSLSIAISKLKSKVLELEKSQPNKKRKKLKKKRREDRSSQAIPFPPSSAAAAAQPFSDDVSVQEVVETLMSQAIDLAESDNLEGALALFQQLSSKDPANAKAYENKGVTLMRLGRYPEARASFMKAKSLMPAANAENLDNNLMALLQHEAYARSTQGAGDGDGDDDDDDDEWPGDSAVNTYGNGNEDEDEDGYDDTPILVTMPGRNPSSSSSSSDKNRNNEAASSSTSDDFTQQAIGLAEAGDMVGALPLFSAAAKRDPKNGRMHENLGVTQMRLGLLVAARSSLERASKAFARSEGPSPSLSGNFNALKGHEEFARTSGRDPHQMYQEYDHTDGTPIHTSSSSSSSSSNNDNDAALDMDDGDWDDWNDEDDDSEGEGFDVHPSSSSHSSSKSGSSSKKYSSTSKDSDELTDEAIDLAESGDVFGALQLFKAAAQQSQRDPQLWENLGVTQMRLGLLAPARKSLEKAASLFAVDSTKTTTGSGSGGGGHGGGSASLQGNLAALAEHDVYATSISHDPTTVYAEFADQAGRRGSDGGGGGGGSGRGSSGRGSRGGGGKKRQEPKHHTQGFCDDGMDVVSVSVGDRVQVRDVSEGSSSSSSSWSEGVVEAVDSKTGMPSVAKDGWPLGYEWEECRPMSSGSDSSS